MASGLPNPELVQSMFDEGAQYMEQLLEENEQLRLALVREKEAQRQAVAAEMTRLHQQVTLATEEARALRVRLDTLQGALDGTRAQSRELVESCNAMQEKQAALSALYAASLELHASLELESVLRALKEIVINLLGSESFGVYVAERQAVLRICVEMGIPPLAPRTLEFGHGPIGTSVLADSPWIEPPPAADVPLVVIPLRVREHVAGTLAIFRFLAHKPGITELDRELFRLLSAQAATALHGAALYAKEARRAATFEGLIDLVRGGAGVASPEPAEGRS